MVISDLATMSRAAVNTATTRHWLRTMAHGLLRRVCRTVVWLIW